MLPNHLDLLVRQEQYQDLLREAAQERFIQAAIRQPSAPGGLFRQAANWLGFYVVRLGRSLQAHHRTGPTCCGDCCLVELRANSPT
jgi:hypothetical protein